MNLTTFENYMLLSVHPNSGKPMAGMFYHGLVGALLTDVHKAERLQIGNEFLVVNDTSSVDIPVVDFLLHKIGTFKEYKKISYWIPQLATNKVFKKLMIEYMAEKKLMRIDRKTFLGYPTYRFFMIDISIRKTLVHTLRENIKSEKPEYLLLGLLVSTNLDSLLTSNTLTAKQVKQACVTVQNKNIVASLVAKVIHKQKLIDLWIAIFILFWVLLIFMGAQK